MLCLRTDVRIRLSFASACAGVSKQVGAQRIYVVHNRTLGGGRMRAVRVPNRSYGPSGFIGREPERIRYRLGYGSDAAAHRLGTAAPSAPSAEHRRR
ncbi:hypothetical protein C8259_07495 [Nocardia nova]|uniref:Uncharacterized protein n=1 Tax=Nocardia nova TaxID=37330 RepID=A0A2T2ZAN4_9NOCA|nr:hypothetical protein C8259_07495 [Nocardia nova]